MKTTKTMMRLAATGMAVTVFAGCSTPKVGQVLGKIASTEVSKVQTEIQTQYTQAVENCFTTLDGMRRDLAGETRTAIVLALTGVIAGSVIAPTLLASNAAKSAVAGWTSLSGATNAAQFSRDRFGRSPS